MRLPDGIRIVEWRKVNQNSALLSLKQIEATFSPAFQCNNREGAMRQLGLTRGWAGRQARRRRHIGTSN